MLALFVGLWLIATSGVGVEAIPAQFAPAISGSTTPQNLMIPPLGIDETTVSLIWSKPADYRPVIGYRVYANGRAVAATKNLFYDAASLLPEQRYRFEVRALLAGGGESAASNPVDVTTRLGPVLNVLDFGAKGDGQTKDTAAIQAAIRACPVGGKVWLPPGKTFLSGALFLKSDCTFQVDGTLLGSDQIGDYPRTSWRFPYYASGPNFMGLVNAYADQYLTMKRVRIAGSGLIDGTADAYDQRIDGGLTKLGAAQLAAGGDSNVRADLITVKGVDGLFIGGGLTLRHPAMHTIFVSYSKNITVNAVHVETYNLQNADGIDLATSDTAYIYNSTFDSGDDCINFNAGVGAPGVADKHPAQNIRVFACTTLRGHGGVVFGSFTAAWIQNVLIEDCVFRGTEIGLRFKTGERQGGGARNVVARDCLIDGTSRDAGIFLGSNYPPTYPSGGPGQFQNIAFSNLTIRAPQTVGISISGLPDTPHHDLRFTNVTISDAGVAGVYLNWCRDAVFDSVQISGSTPAWYVDGGLAAINFANCSPFQAPILKN